MSAAPERSAFDEQALEVLQALGKTLSQMNLYTAKHPAVQAMIRQCGGALGECLKAAEAGELVYSIDDAQLIANGRIIGAVSQVPGSVPQIFSRYKLNSLTFRACVTDAELSALCELAALRPEAAKDTVAGDFLASRGVERIAVNAAVYAKVEVAPDQEASPQLVGDAAAAFVETLKDRSLGQIVEQLVASLVPDPAERARIIEAVLARIQGEITKAVEDATRTISREKTVLRNEAARAQAVVGTMADGVVTVDDQGQVLMMNPEAEDLFGAKLQEMAGKSIEQFAKEDHLVALAKGTGRPSAEAEEEAGVKAAARGDAGRALRASTVVVRNEEGKTVGMVSALTDAAKHRDLQKREREFVAHVTHELRAPLASIIAALELLNDDTSGKLQGSSVKMMDSARRNADRLEQLINNILDFSKLEAGQMSVAVKPVAGEQIARDALESLQPWAHKKGLQLRLEAAPGLPTVLADHGRSVQILVNLISNAIKFSPKGETIFVRARPGKEGFVRYSVKDNGPGIPKAEHARVFEKFVQIQSGETNVGGTGLGLAIAKMLVHLQKGEMWLESEPGRGAEFLFSLPRYVAPEGEQPAPAAGPEPELPWWKRLFGLQ